MLLPRGAAIAMGCCCAALHGMVALETAATLPPETLGRIVGVKSIRETRAGQLCDGRVSFLAVPADDAGAESGSIEFQSPCVASAEGTWQVDETTQMLRWRLEYDRSSVFYSAPLDAFAAPQKSNRVKGDVLAAPRSEPEAMRKVGSFDLTLRSR